MYWSEAFSKEKKWEEEIYFKGCLLIGNGSRKNNVTKWTKRARFKFWIFMEKGDCLTLGFRMPPSQLELYENCVVRRRREDSKCLSRIRMVIFESTSIHRHYAKIMFLSTNKKSYWLKIRIFLKVQFLGYHTGKLWKITQPVFLLLVKKKNSNTTKDFFRGAHVWFIFLLSWNGNVYYLYVQHFKAQGGKMYDHLVGLLLCITKLL